MEYNGSALVAIDELRHGSTAVWGSANDRENNMKNVQGAIVYTWVCRLWTCESFKMFKMVYELKKEDQAIIFRQHVVRFCIHYGS